MEVSGEGGVVTDSHLVNVARAARVVPLSAEAFVGLSCRFSFYSKPETLEHISAGFLGWEYLRFVQIFR